MKLGIHYRQELASALPSDPNWLRLETQLSRSRSTTRPPRERVARSSRRLLPISDQHRLPSVVGWTTASHWRLAPDCGPMVGFALPPRRRCGCGLPLRLLASSEEKPRRDAGEPMIRLRLQSAWATAPPLRRRQTPARASTRLRKPGSSASRCPTAALLPMQPWRPPHGESLLRLVHFATLAHGARRGRVRADAEVEQRDVLTRRPLSQCLRERASGQTRPCVVLRLVRSGSQLGRCRDSRVDLSRRLGIRTRSALGSVAPTVVVST